MKKILFLLVSASVLFSCKGPLRDKDTYEDNVLGPDSIGTPGFNRDTTIRIDSAAVDRVKAREMSEPKD